MLYGKRLFLPKEEADFVGALKHQDAGRSETQGVFSSISALKETHLSAFTDLRWHAETSDLKRKEKKGTHLHKVHVYAVKLQPLAFVEERNLCLRWAVSPERRHNCHFKQPPSGKIHKDSN